MPKLRDILFDLYKENITNQELEEKLDTEYMIDSSYQVRTMMEKYLRGWQNAQQNAQNLFNLGAGLGIQNIGQLINARPGAIARNEE